MVSPFVTVDHGLQDTSVLDLMSAGTVPVEGWTSFSAITVQTVYEILTEEASRPTFLLDELIHGRATLLYGPAKAGKTHLVVEFVTAVSRHEPWHGRQANS